LTELTEFFRQEEFVVFLTEIFDRMTGFSGEVDGFLDLKLTNLILKTF
jgi:hypothetical protein